MAEIRIKNVKKVYPTGAVGVSEVNMEIADGEFTVITGGAGSGKSALIRMICGLDDVTEGEIVMDGAVINELMPKDRDIAIVVKSLGLFPNLNVFENLAYGLKLRKMPKNEIDARVNDVARILDLTDVLSRKPKNVSTLERQRVLLGRAIARCPKLIILDDPFSDFNDSIRQTLCGDILKIQKRMNVNFIYVTKSAAEAFELADKIAYFDGGKLVQYGSVEEIYDAPKTIPIARFFGQPPVNLFIGKFVKEDSLKFSSSNFTLELDKSLEEAVKDYVESGKEVQLSIRAEDLSLGSDFEGTMQEVAVYGDKQLVAFSVEGDDSAHYALVGSDFEFKKGEKIGLRFDLSHANFYDLISEMNLLK